MVGPAATADQNGGAQLAQRSLLLFEDFDQLLDSDDGFMASVATLLNKSKVCLASSLPVPLMPVLTRCSMHITAPALQRRSACTT